MVCHLLQSVARNSNPSLLFHKRSLIRERDLGDITIFIKMPIAAINVKQAKP